MLNYIVRQDGNKNNSTFMKQLYVLNKADRQFKQFSYVRGLEF